MITDEVRQRFDGYGYGLFLLLIAGMTYLVIKDFGWGIGIFCCVLMLAVLELGYRLATRS
jgi:hypothetical protein